MNLFNAAEATADDKVPEPKLTEVTKHYRNKASESKYRLLLEPVETAEA